MVHLPNSPLDGGDAVMQLAVPTVAKNRVILSAKPKPRPESSPKRPEPPPETLSPPGPPVANQEGEIAMLHQQLMFSGYIAQAIGMLQEREAW